VNPSGSAREPDIGEQQIRKRLATVLFADPSPKKENPADPKIDGAFPSLDFKSA
jgi:hypothetical protein